MGGEAFPDVPFLDSHRLADPGNMWKRMDGLADARHAEPVGLVYLTFAVLFGALAYLSLVGAWMTGEISDIGVWLFSGVLGLLALASFSAWKSEDGR